MFDINDYGKPVGWMDMAVLGGMFYLFVCGVFLNLWIIGCVICEILGL